MEKILYCKDSSSKKRIPFSFSFHKTSNLRDAYTKDYSLVIFEDKFLKKRKNLRSCRLKNKVCFIHFPQEAKGNLSLVRKLGFFDYFTNQDSQAQINFKLKQAQEVIRLKRQINSLEEQLKDKDAQIDNMLLIDPLTGCYNWRYFLNCIPQEINRSRRHLYSVSFIAIDLDYFRHINEIYGVKIADFIIKDLVALLNKILREEDVLVRWREDEFFIIAPHLARKDTYKVAQRISNKITFHKFKYKNVTVHLKASIGVVSSPEDSVFNSRDIINALNSCLSTAKRKGGNTIVIYTQRFFKPVPQHPEKADISELRAKIEKMNVLMSRDLLEMIYGFARAIEAKDSYTGQHVEYTAVLAEEIAKGLKLSEKEVEDIRHAAVLHDLGKVAIDEGILSKKGRLNSREWEAIRSHPSVAAEILREIHGLRGAIPAVLYHHERYDGKGYPLGLKGEEIPLSARIVAVADVYQALISDRPYRKAYSKKKAVQIIKSQMGKQFDPKIVKMFLKIVNKIDEQR